MDLIKYHKNRIRSFCRRSATKQELLILEGAFMDIESLYRGQIRCSGVPVVLHSLRVAELLCRIGADVNTIVAGLLHDVAEDTRATAADIQKSYGSWFAGMSEALKKTDHIQLTHQKILHAGRHDYRSLVIKICDRLDNMREIRWLPEQKRRRISRETLGFYLPIACRLNLPGEIPEELRSLSEPHIR